MHSSKNAMSLSRAARTLAAALWGALALPVFAQTPASLSIPDKVATPLGTLDFKDGAPSTATTQKLFDNLDFLHAQNVVLDTFQGASTYALREGLRSVGAEDNSVIIFSDLMDSNSLFLTANCDVIYFISIVDLSKGPMVIEVPPARSAPSTTCGLNGSSTPGHPGQTGDKAVNT
jgi:hypothetical protein